MPFGEGLGVAHLLKPPVPVVEQHLSYIPRQSLNITNICIR
jgi:hypothetical protein